jgi:hypothetical protein
MPSALKSIFLPFIECNFNENPPIHKGVDLYFKCENLPKKNIYNIKNSKVIWFLRVSITQNAPNMNKNCQIYIFCFMYLAKNIQNWYKICISLYVYCQMVKSS